MNLLRYIQVEKKLPKLFVVFIWTNDEIIVNGWLGNNWELVLNLSADVLLVFYFIFSKPSYKNIFLIINNYFFGLKLIL